MILYRLLPLPAWPGAVFAYALPYRHMVLRGEVLSGFDSACALLPENVRAAARALEAHTADRAEEFRLRLGQRPAVTMPEGERMLPGSPAVDKRCLRRLLEIATMGSPYASAAAMARGYIYAPGGVRVGICGRVRRGAEERWASDGITSAAVRIPREVRGVGEAFCALPFPSTLILSPPGGGKTTLLRDMIRCLSSLGERVAVCDERGEIAGCGSDGFAFDVGPRTDVLSDVPKDAAGLQLLRTMNPRIVAMDEITAGEDAAACLHIAWCGAALIATAHAGSKEEFLSGELWRQLEGRRVFARLICIVRTEHGREYREELI